MYILGILDFSGWWLVGAFCNFGVSDTGSPVYFWGFFSF